MSATHPILDPYLSAGLLIPADAHVASRLLLIHARQHAPQPNDDLVTLAAAFAVRGLRTGATAIDLTELERGASDTDTPVVVPWPDPDKWRSACTDHPLVSQTEDADDRPLRRTGSLLYLQRYWQEERRIRDFVANRARAVRAHDPDQVREVLDRYFPEATPDPRRLAAANMVLRGLTILAGGPGTGKTTTIARVIEVLRAVEPGRLTIALAAPTGKAAARMQEATNRELAASAGAALTATTLHRLLGWLPGAGRFRHNGANPLPHDVVIVDECSMVSLTLMSRLIDALQPRARLVLIGDPDQLASVEAGAVLSDLVAVATPAAASVRSAVDQVAPRDQDVPLAASGGVRLRHGFRFSGPIADLAAAINTGAADTALALLRDDGSSQGSRIDFVEVASGERPDDPRYTGALRADVVATGTEVRDAAAAGDAAAALAALDRHRLLCAHREGQFGVAHWNRLVRSWFSARPWGSSWTIGQGLIITANDYTLGVSNGDTGVIVANADGGEPLAAFATPGGISLIPSIRLVGPASLDAITIHRGQGSQFDTVTIILPPPESRLLTRELLYTGVTRARRVVRLIGSAESVRAAISRRVTRASGLTGQLTARLDQEDAGD